MKLVKTLFLYTVTIPGVIILMIMIQRYVLPLFQEQVQTAEITLNSIMCDMCASKIQSAVNSLNGVIQSDVSIDQKKALVSFNSLTNVEKIVDAITSAGYDANDKKADTEAYNNLPDCCKQQTGIKKSNSCSGGCCNN